MKLIGFNLEEISAKKTNEFKRSNISTDITFNDVDKFKLDLLKDDETIKASFRFQVNYKDTDNQSNESKNEVVVAGSILLMVTKDESKEFIKAWKNKKLPEDKMLPLYNFILKKCSVKALQLEEDLGLQPHIPFPQVKSQPKN